MVTCYSSPRKVIQNPSPSPSLLPPFLPHLRRSRSPHSGPPNLAPSLTLGLISSLSPSLPPLQRAGPSAAPQTCRCTAAFAVLFLPPGMPFPDLPAGRPSSPLVSAPIHLLSEALPNPYPYLKSFLLCTSFPIPSSALFFCTNPSLSETL